MPATTLMGKENEQPQKSKLRTPNQSQTPEMRSFQQRSLITKVEKSPTRVRRVITTERHVSPVQSRRVVTSQTVSSSGQTKTVQRTMITGGRTMSSGQTVTTFQSSDLTPEQVMH